MKRVMLYTAVILATLVVLQILWQFNLVLALFVLSLFVAATIRPWVEWLAERGLSRAAAQLLLYVIGIGGFLLLLFLAGDLLLQELNIAANRSVVAYEAMYRRWEIGASWQQMAVAALPAPFIPTTAQDAEIEQMLPVVVNVTRGLTAAIGGLLLLLALSIYWSVDQHRFERLWLSLLPAKRRAYARDSWREIETAVGNYIRSQIIQSVLAAFFLGVGAVVIGFPFPLLLAFLGGLAAFIPLFGSLLAAITAFVLGFLESAGVGIGTAVYTLLLFVGLELLVEPRLWHRKRRGFLLIFLLIIPLVDTFGFWGLVLAPPLAAALEVVIKQTYQVYLVQRTTAVKLGDLENRYQQLVQKVSRAQEGKISPELKNLVERLAPLLAEAQHNMHLT